MRRLLAKLDHSREPEVTGAQLSIGQYHSKVYKDYERVISDLAVLVQEKPDKPPMYAHSLTINLIKV